MRSGPADTRETAGNRLLAALPPADYARLRPHLEPVALARGDVLYDVDVPIAHAYFPTGGVVSLVTPLAGGVAIEVAMVGDEGLVGLPVFLGSPTSRGRALVQVPGAALRLPAAHLAALAPAAGPLPALLRRYTQALLTQIAQGAACGRAHGADQRCARWLLLAHDRAGGDQLPLTHEFLAQMLGVRRATVTEGAGRLQAAGLIRHRRGVVTILDRAGLEAAACECYRVIRGEYARLLG